MQGSCQSCLLISNFLLFPSVIPADYRRFKLLITCRRPRNNDGRKSHVCFPVSIVALAICLVICWAQLSPIPQRHLSYSDQISRLFHQFNLTWIIISISKLALPFLFLFLIFISVTFLIRINDQLASLLLKSQDNLWWEQLLKGHVKVAHLFDEFNDVHFLFQLVSSLLKGALIPISTVTARNATTEPREHVLSTKGETAHFHIFVAAMTAFAYFYLIFVLSFFYFEKLCCHKVVDRVKVPRSKKQDKELSEHAFQTTNV